MNTKFPAILLLVLSTLMLTAKDKDSNDKDSDKKGFNRLYIGLSVTPDAGFRFVNKNFVPSGTSNGDVKGVVDYANKHTYPQVGVMAGVKAGVYLTKWLAIETGVQYSLVRYEYKSDVYYTDQVYSGTSNYNVMDSFKTQDGNTYHYLDVPISLNFSLGKKKVRGIISAGVNLDFLIKKKLNYTYTYSDGSTYSNVVVDRGNFRTFNVSPFLGIGADFYLTSRCVLRIMPVAQVQALKNINTPITEYLWNAGLNISVFFGFLRAGR